MNKQVVRGMCLAWALPLACSVASAQGSAGKQHAPGWIGSWACAPVPEGKGKAALPFQVFAEEGTVRDVVHLSAGGQAVRVRVSNEFGTAPLLVNGLHVAVSAGADAIAAGSDHTALFAGKPAVTIPAGKAIFSDAIAMPVPGLATLAISILLPKQTNTLTMHERALATSYYATGSQLSASPLGASRRVNSWMVVTGVDVQASPGGGTIVAIGDSITDGMAGTVNGNMRWPDELARRLQAAPATANLGVVNMGIGGNRVLQDGNGQSLLHRFDRDVLAQSGAKWVIVLESTNDIGFAAHGRGGQIVNAAQIVDGMKEIVARGHAHGLKVYGATVLPFGGGQQGVPEGLKMREEVNAAIRTGKVFDAFIDLAKATEDPADPAKLRADLDSGGHVHPSDAGYKAMGEAVDLSLFR